MDKSQLALQPMERKPLSILQPSRFGMLLALTIFSFGALFAVFNTDHLRATFASRGSALPKRLWSRTTASSPSLPDWEPCGGPVQCGRLDVPLDYFDEPGETLSLALARIPASDLENRIGILFVNPGGPGGSGVSFIYRKGEMLHQLLDGRYDIVSWDPRGVNNSAPLRCFPSETAQTLFAHHVDLDSMGTGNLSVPVERVVFRQQLRAWDGRLRLAGELCAKNGGSVMRYMDTGTVARDLEQLSSVISGPNTPINYWGFSGGSIIGSYWVNMFPHRVGRVILDGNGNPEEWAHSQFSEWTSNSMVDSMKAFRNFAKACAEAGAQRCALARKESTPESIEADIDSLIAHLEVRPLPVLNTSFPDIVTSQHIKLLLWQAAFAPATWPNVATLLAAAISGDGSGIITNLSSVELDTTVPASARFVFDQVMCMDAPALSPHEASVAVDKLEEAVVRMYQGGNKYFASWRMKACHAWQVRGKYRFDGPFNHTLRNPILVIGNTADPVTPLRNAMRVHELLGNSSRLLIQDSTGHCSISTVSLCTTNAIRGYLLDGNLPQNGLLCSPSETPFPALDRQEMEDFTSDDMRFLQVAKNLRHTWEHNPLYL